MFRKTLIIITLLPAMYFWLATVIAGITRPFFAALVAGGLMGAIGLIRAGWGLGLKSPDGSKVTQLLLGAGVLSALSGVVFLSYYGYRTDNLTAPILLAAIIALSAVTIVGIAEFARLREAGKARR